MKNKKEYFSIEFNKFSISSDGRQFILKYFNDIKNRYYVNFESLLLSIPNKHLLKSEAENIEELLNELKKIKKDIINIAPKVKTLK